MRDIEIDRQQQQKYLFSVNEICLTKAKFFLLLLYYFVIEAASFHACRIHEEFSSNKPAKESEMFIMTTTKKCRTKFKLNLFLAKFLLQFS
jgi:hypothetical protein